VHNDIITAQQTSSIRTLTNIEKDMAVAETEFYKAVNDVLYYYSSNEDIDSLTWYLEDTLDTDASHILLVGTLLDLDNATDARTILEGIDLDDDTNEEAIYNFYDIAVSLAEESKTWFEMSEGQTDTIQTLAASEYDIAVNAQAVLSLVFDSVYTRVPEALPESKWDGEQPQVQQQQEEENSLRKINIYPNPFNNNFNINYMLEQEAENVRIEVYDLLGRNIFTKAIANTASGTINIDLAECLGVYVLRIFADEKQVHKEKLICMQRQ
jgi:hypothetical protein